MRGDVKGRFKSLLATALTLVMTILNITGRRSRLSGGGRATCPDFRSHPV